MKPTEQGLKIIGCKLTKYFGRQKAYSQGSNHLWRRYLDPQNLHQTPSQEVFGSLEQFQVTCLFSRGCFLALMPGALLICSMDGNRMMDFYIIYLHIYIYTYIFCFLLYVVEKSNLYISPDIQIPPQQEFQVCFCSMFLKPSTRLGPEIVDLLVRSARDVQTGSALWWRPKLVARLEREELVQ